MKTQRVLTMLVLVLTLAGSVSAELVAHWKLDEGSGIIATDSSGNGHHGTAQNGVPTWVDGQPGYGKAIHWDGSNPSTGWINCGRWNPSAATGQLTVATWAKWDGPNEAHQGLIGKRDGWDAEGAQMMWCMEIGKDTHDIYFYRAGSWPPCGGIVLPEGQWSHVAATFDGSTMIFYVDGAETGRGGFSFGAKTDATIAFGCVEGNGWIGFNGALDDVRIYDHALSATEVAALAGGEKAFTYQGRLLNEGRPADRDEGYDFQFKLYEDPAGASQIGPDVNKPDVDVIDGYFTVELDFGSDIFTGDARWLEVGVRPGDLDDPNEYTILLPRQEITPTPYAVYAERAGSVTGGVSGDGDSQWTLSGSDIYYNDGNVGIGTPSPSNKLSVLSSSGGEGISVVNNNGYGKVVMSITGGGSGFIDVFDESSGSTRISTDISYFAGNVGIGTTSPKAGLHINRADSWGSLTISNKNITYDETHFDYPDAKNYIRGTTIIADTGGNVGVGTTNPEAKLEVAGPVKIVAQLPWPFLGKARTEIYGRGIDGYVSLGGEDADSPLYLNGVSSGDVLVAQGGGQLITPVLSITGGSDLSEQFEISSEGSEVTPGMVVSIDAESPGSLVVSDKAYDRRVAGIISGAGGVKPGMLMGQQGTEADGTNPVALTGRVYCWADASNGPIQPGDLLTTSDTPGHAMKVKDYPRAQGAIIGKAMSSLESGRGLVLVLVSLQ